MGLIKIILDLIKIILNVKKWITMPYRVYKFCRDHPRLSIMNVCIVLGGIALYVINVN